MAANSKIEWTDASWNPIRARTIDRIDNQTGWHCVHVSEGCRNCYAENFNQRLGTGLDFKPGNEKRIDVYVDEKMLLAPLHWRRPRKIFVGSMSDLFADFVSDEMLDRIFAVMALCPQHTFQLLTKRPARMRTFVSEPGRDAAIALEMQDFTGSSAGDSGLKWPLPNVWLGTSCENQETADERIPELLATPAAVRFLSCEPLLGPIDLANLPGIGCAAWRYDALAGVNVAEVDGERVTGFPRGKIDWVICGGESGPHARPMHPDWARTLRDQCAASAVPFFFKQWGEWLPVSLTPDASCMIFDDTGGEYRTFPRGTRIDALKGQAIGRVGKKAAGRLLDGRTHDDLPGAMA